MSGIGSIGTQSLSETGGQKSRDTAIWEVSAPGGTSASRRMAKPQLYPRDLPLLLRNPLPSGNGPESTVTESLQPTVEQRHQSGPGRMHSVSAYGRRPGGKAGALIPRGFEPMDVRRAGSVFGEARSCPEWPESRRNRGSSRAPLYAALRARVLDRRKRPMPLKFSVGPQFRTEEPGVCKREAPSICSAAGSWEHPGQVGNLPHELCGSTSSGYHGAIRKLKWHWAKAPVLPFFVTVRGFPASQRAGRKHYRDWRRRTARRARPEQPRRIVPGSGTGEAKS